MCFVLPPGARSRVAGSVRHSCGAAALGVRLRLAPPGFVLRRPAHVLPALAEWPPSNAFVSKIKHFRILHFREKSEIQFPNGRTAVRSLGDRARFSREKSEIQSPNGRTAVRSFGKKKHFRMQLCRFVKNRDAHAKACAHTKACAPGLPRPQPSPPPRLRACSALAHEHTRPRRTRHARTTRARASLLKHMLSHGNTRLHVKSWM